MDKNQPMIIALGGGKGGVGKSMVCSNIAIQYAKAGLRVILVDLDIGGANVHTIFGMRQPPKGLGEFFTTPRSKLNDYIIPTEIEGLQIVAGGGFFPELANLRHMQKIKLIHNIRSLNADLVLLDLGAGSSHRVIDFFSMTQAGIVVTTPEPTAVVNAYEFLKNVVYRIMFRLFRNQKELLELVRASGVPQGSEDASTLTNLIENIASKSSWAAQNIRDVCSDLDFYLILNQARKPEDVQLGLKLCDLCKRYLNLNLHFAGMVYHNEEVSSAVLQMTPVSLAFPESVTSSIIKRLASEIFKQMAAKMMGKPREEEKERLVRVQRHAIKDFKLNHLTQRRLQRQS